MIRDRALPRPPLFDVLMVVLLVVLSVVEDLFADARMPDTTATHEPDVVGFALILIAIVPLLWHRSRPMSVFVIEAVGFSARFLAGYVLVSGVQWAALVAIYSVGAYARRPQADAARWVGGILLVGVFAIGAILERAPVYVVVVMFGFWLAIGFLGETVYVRRAYQETLEENARRLVAQQEEQARRAVLDERARIARDLHDVWAHTVSLIVVQAGAAQEVFDTKPDLARQALGAIQDAGRKALAEVRRMVAGDDDGGAHLTPAPGIDDLDGLIGEFTDAALGVTMERHGDFDGLAEDLSLTLYRIVQQALTNTLSHGGPGVTAVVTLNRDADEITLRIEDDGLGADAAATSHDGRGLIGMRERASLFGGTLSAGPTPDGYLIQARIPWVDTE